MAARKSSRVNRKYKTKYRVTNWDRAAEQRKPTAHSAQR